MTTVPSPTSSSTAITSSSDPTQLNPTSWWTVDSSRQSELTRGATPLVERCRRRHGWSAAFALRVLQGYQVFLDSKRFAQDYKAKRLSPSIPVDQMWHAHILDTQNYAQDCQLLVGHMVHHDPDGDIDDPARQTRIENMKNVLQVRFGDSYDKEVWNFGEFANENDRRVRARLSPERPPPQQPSIANPTIPNTNATSVITISVRNGAGQSTFFRMKKSTKIGSVVCGLRTATGFPDSPASLPVGRYTNQLRRHTRDTAT